MAYDMWRWDVKDREYKRYQPDPDWHVAGYSTDMDEIINCASCGKEITFGDSYTSQEIHTKNGLGWCVCERCYEDETNRRRGVQYA